MPDEVEVPEPIKVEAATKEAPPKVEVKLDEKERVESEDKRWKAMENQLAASRRVAERLEKKLEELTVKPAEAKAPAAHDALGAQALPEGTPQTVIDKYDKLVQDGQWQKAVDLKIEEGYKRLREAEKAQESLVEAQQRATTTFEKTKAEVLSKYTQLDPEKGDEASLESQLYNQAINELSEQDPAFLKNPYAPKLAMARMEELASEQGIKLNATKSTGQSPTLRMGRVGPTSMPVSRGSGSASRPSLSPEQKEWMEQNPGVDPALYTKIAAGDFSGGIEA